MPDAADPATPGETLTDHALSYLWHEATYWRRRAEAAEDRIRLAAAHYPDVPPEPPIGTDYLDGETVAWRRTEAGWYCGGVGCRNCPVEWAEVWDRDVSRGTLTPRLPGAPDRGVVSPERDRHP